MKKLALVLALALTGSVFGQDFLGLDSYKEVKNDKKVDFYKKQKKTLEDGVSYWFMVEHSVHGLIDLMNEAFLVSHANGVIFDVTLYQATEAATDNDVPLNLTVEYEDGSYMMFVVNTEDAYFGVWEPYTE